MILFFIVPILLGVFMNSFKGKKYSVYKSLTLIGVLVTPILFLFFFVKIFFNTMPYLNYVILSWSILFVILSFANAWRQKNNISIKPVKFLIYLLIFCSVFTFTYFVATYRDWTSDYAFYTRQSTIFSANSNPFTTSFETGEKGFDIFNNSNVLFYFVATFGYFSKSSIMQTIYIGSNALFAFFLVTILFHMNSFIKNNILIIIATVTVLTSVVFVEGYYLEIFYAWKYIVSFMVTIVFITEILKNGDKHPYYLLFLNAFAVSSSYSYGIISGAIFIIILIMNKELKRTIMLSCMLLAEISLSFVGTNDNISKIIFVLFVSLVGVSTLLPIKENFNLKIPKRIANTHTKMKSMNMINQIFKWKHCIIGVILFVIILSLKFHTLSLQGDIKGLTIMKTIIPLSLTLSLICLSSHRTIRTLMILSFIAMIASVFIYKFNIRYIGIVCNRFAELITGELFFAAYTIIFATLFVDGRIKKIFFTSMFALVFCVSSISTKSTTEYIFRNLNRENRWLSNEYIEEMRKHPSDVYGLYDEYTIGSKHFISRGIFVNIHCKIFAMQNNDQVEIKKINESINAFIKKNGNLKVYVDFWPKYLNGVHTLKEIMKTNEIKNT